MNPPVDNKKTSTQPPPVPGGKPTTPAGPPTDAAKTATTTVSATPENKPDGKPEDKDDGGEGEGEDKASNRSKFFIVVGKLHEFETIAKAEAFLNGPDGPKDFHVVRGHEVKPKQRVTLRG